MCVLIVRGPHSTSADMSSSLNKVFRLVTNGDMDGLKAFFSTDDTIDLNQMNPSTKLTPLMVACNRPSVNLPMIELLIVKGAEVDYQYHGGYADPNSESYGKTPLMSSILNINTAKMLIDSGANVNLQDNEGGYAMQYAIKEENYEVVEVLLEKGADVTLCTDNGDSVASILQRDSKQILVSETSNINNYINNIPFLYT